MTSKQYHLIIIGTGVAGYLLAKEWRRRSPDKSLLLITEGEGNFYMKPMLSQAFLLNKTADDLIQKSVQEMREELSADVLINTPVEKLNLTEDKIICKNGTEYFYHNVVLALGSSPRKIPALQSLPSINQWNDYRLGREQLKKAKRVAIIGAGLVGVEFAHDWAAHGFEVDLIHDQETPMDTLLPSFIGEAVRDALIKLGVHWYPNEIVSEASTQRIRCVQSERMVDWAVSCTGLIPNTQMAKEAGLTVNKAVSVDAYGRTSHHNVYALGECAQVCGVSTGYIAPIREQACSIAATLSGQPTTIPQQIFPIVVKTPSQPTVVAFQHQKKGLWAFEGCGSERQALLLDNQQTTGFALTGITTVKKRMELLKTLRGLEHKEQR